MTNLRGEITAAMPARYHDARPGLRLRVVDLTEDQIPDHVPSQEIGDDLAVVPTWYLLAVTLGLMGRWGVSIDELVATATENVASLSTEHTTIRHGEASIEGTLGHHWVSSLIVELAHDHRGEDGFLVAVPRSDVLAVTQVTGVETIDGLDALIGLNQGIYDPADLGVSPHVWWWFGGAYRRVTDRTEDGSLDFLYHTNLSAYHLAGAIGHLANPCIECGRD